MDNAPRRELIDELELGATRLLLGCDVGAAGVTLAAFSTAGDSLAAFAPWEPTARIAFGATFGPPSRGPCPSASAPAWLAGRLPPPRGAVHVAFAPVRVPPGAWAEGELFWLARRFLHAVVRLRGSGPDVPPGLAWADRAADAAARHLITSCEGSAVAAARRLHRAARWFAYGAIAADPTGRVAQLAACCPGAILFAAGIAGRGAPAAAAADLLAGAARGERLSTLLGRAVASFRELEQRRAEDARARGRPPPGWSRLDGDGARRPQPSDALRTLVRRAGPLVDPGALLSIAPAAFAPEDIPTAPRRNAAWYDAMAWATAVAESHRVPPESWSFLSRHAGRIRGLRFRLRRALRIPRARLEDAVHHAVATRAWPKRGTDPSRWLREMLLATRARAAEDRLAIALDALRQLDGEVEEIRALDPGLGWPERVGPRFPSPELVVPSIEGVELRPIEHALELAAEAMEMKHCVATHGPRLAGGRHSLWRGVVLGERVTVELRHDAGGYDVAEARGVGNRPLGPAQWDLVRRWAAEARPAPADEQPASSGVAHA